MRSYIRHPTDVPIELSPAGRMLGEHSRVQNVSVGGLSLKSGVELKLQTLINIRIPSVEPPFETVGLVVWCTEKYSGYEIGVQFINEQDAYAVRMVEQICHIEHYRIKVREKEGRSLNAEEAAGEWIEKYAKDFPPINTSNKQSINQLSKHVNSQ
jgi:hypothetical protein